MLFRSIDVATLDLEAQAAGVPIAALLAPGHATTVRVNAVIGEGDPVATVGFAREALAQGYGVLKAKVGARPLAEDVARIAALREACPDAVIRLDANGAWDEATALAAVRALAPLDIELLEQPVPAADVEALARVHDAARGAIAIAEGPQHVGQHGGEPRLVVGAGRQRLRKHLRRAAGDAERVVVDDDRAAIALEAHGVAEIGRAHV